MKAPLPSSNPSRVVAAVVQSPKGLLPNINRYKNAKKYNHRYSFLTMVEENDHFQQGSAVKLASCALQEGVQNIGGMIDAAAARQQGLWPSQLSDALAFLRSIKYETTKYTQIVAQINAFFDEIGKEQSMAFQSQLQKQHESYVYLMNLYSQGISECSEKIKVRAPELENVKRTLCAAKLRCAALTSQKRVLAEKLKSFEKSMEKKKQKQQKQLLKMQCDAIFITDEQGSPKSDSIAATENSPVGNNYGMSFRIGKVQSSQSPSPCSNRNESSRSILSGGFEKSLQQHLNEYPLPFQLQLQLPLQQGNLPSSCKNGVGGPISNTSKSSSTNCYSRGIPLNSTSCTNRNQPMLTGYSNKSVEVVQLQQQQQQSLWHSKQQQKQQQTGCSSPFVRRSLSRNTGHESPSEAMIRSSKNQFAALDRILQSSVKNSEIASRMVKKSVHLSQEGGAIWNLNDGRESCNQLKTEGNETGIRQNSKSPMSTISKNTDNLFLNDLLNKYVNTSKTKEIHFDTVPFNHSNGGNTEENEDSLQFVLKQIREFKQKNSQLIGKIRSEEGRFERFARLFDECIQLNACGKSSVTVVSRKNESSKNQLEMQYSLMQIVHEYEKKESSRIEQLLHEDTEKVVNRARILSHNGLNSRAAAVKESEKNVYQMLFTEFDTLQPKGLMQALKASSVLSKKFTRKIREKHEACLKLLGEIKEIESTSESCENGNGKAKRSLGRIIRAVSQL